MSRELRDVTISHVSMVKKGANQKKFFLYTFYERCRGRLDVTRRDFKDGT